MSQWIDITMPVGQSMLCWLNCQPPKMAWAKRIDRGDHCNLSHWHMSAHTGTHVDAPLHFIDSGSPIDAVPLETLLGPCRVIDATDLPDAMLAADLAETVRGSQRMLVRTHHSGATEGTYPPHGMLMSLETAKYLLDAGAILVGTDRLSVDPSSGDRFDVHHALLGRGCVIVEGLRLGAIEPGDYELCVLPLRLEGAEAAPARALIRKVSSRNA